ncbi:hypothetical protein CCP3SC1_60053 [Gammaproteobacteria bacterium]
MTVMVTTLAIMLLVSALIEHYAVNEAKAVDESLARIRIYWAMMGHWNYVASRVLASGVVNNSGGANDYGNFGKFRINPSSRTSITNGSGFYCQSSGTTSNCGNDTSGNDAHDFAPNIFGVLRADLGRAAVSSNRTANAGTCGTTTPETDYARSWHYQDLGQNYCFVITNGFFPTTNQYMALNLRLSDKGSTPVLQNLPTPLPLYVETHLASVSSVKLDRLYRPVF